METRQQIELQSQPQGDAARLPQLLAELEQSRVRIVESHEALRKALAEEIHGRVQNALLFACLCIQKASESLDTDLPAARDHLAQAKSLIERVVQDDLRLIAKQLHPSIVNVGLVAALRSLARGFRHAFTVEPLVSPAAAALETPGGPMLDARLRLGLYRVAEEALNNAAKHSGASVVQLRLDLPRPGSLKLTVEDRGKGFHLDSYTPGLGVLIMKDYTAALGGRLLVESSPGKGARITALVPLTPAPPS